LTDKVTTNNLDIDLKIFTAFSRDTAKKVYVQHRLAENGEQVWNHLQTGIFYICGDAKHMAHDVNTELERIAVKYGGFTEAKAKDWIKNMRSQNRYLEDVWS
jgi:sulfite reductase alpha subunit-like flavoprotein